MPAKEKSSTTVIAKPAPALLTIEGVLDELLAGKITRDEAATRIHELTNAVRG